MTPQATTFCSGAAFETNRSSLRGPAILTALAASVVVRTGVLGALEKDRFHDFTDCACRAAGLRWESMATNVRPDLFATGRWPAGLLEACGPCISQRRTVLVTGRAGSGKTTLIAALARLLPSTEPVLVLDDGEELNLDGPLRELIPLRRADSAKSTREAVARALRGAPPRLVLGNVCPPEAGEVLRALGSDRHHGSLVGIGATSAETALRQLASWSLADGFSWEIACAAIPVAIHVVVRLDRLADGNRRAVEVVHVEQAPGGWALRPA